jgi:tripartite ATP-independent transporter DctM subunit
MTPAAFQVILQQSQALRRSLGQLFMAGLIVGLIMMVLLMVTVAITAKIRGYIPERSKRATFKVIATSLGETIWALIFPILLLVGLRFGLFTPSEVGAFACVYGILVGVFVYRELTWRKFLETLRITVVDVGAVMFIIALSGLFRYGIPFEHVPQTMTALITGFSTNTHVVLLIVIGFLVIAGMFIEGSVCILLFTPILLPMVVSLGVDPVHFGLIMCTTITMGLLTPPVGISMYAVCTILECPTSAYLREMFPFLLTVVIELLLLVYLPDVVLFLPRLLF